MQHKIGTGAVLIRDSASLPSELHFASEPCVPGWIVVTDLDSSGLGREIQKTGWSFFCLAGEAKATVFGIDDHKMLRRAIEQILTRGKPCRFNSLEITRVSSLGSERFPLIHYVTISAQWRHIQCGVLPFGASDTLKSLARENGRQRVSSVAARPFAVPMDKHEQARIQ
jgi:hypothetical protein